MFTKIKALLLIGSFFLFPGLIEADSVSVGVTVFISECSDGVDNDIDGLIDYPNDPDCDNASDDSEATPPTPPPAQPPYGGSGSSQGRDNKDKKTIVIVKGNTHPNGRISVFADAGNITASGYSDRNGRFEISILNIGPGNKTVGVWSEDSRANRSIPEALTLEVASDMITVIDNLLLPSTIATDKREVKKGDNATIFGYTSPFSEVEVFIEDSFGRQVVKKIESDKEGLWKYIFDSQDEDFGSRSVSVKVLKDKKENMRSAKVEFLIGTKNRFIPFKPGVGYAGKGDLNEDRRVNVIDLSILLHWYKKDSPPESIDFDADGNIDLKDLSIMAYYWTG